MELQQMRYAVAVAEEGNFTRAAERCLVVQSALSHQIKALERELGVELFARTSRRVEITIAGEAFIAQARASLAAAERAVAGATAAAGVVRGTLTIGVIPTVTALDVPAVLGAFHRAYPEVRIRLRGGGSDQFIAAIREGTMDLAVLGLSDSTPPAGVATRVLARERLVVVVSQDHPLARRRTLSLEDMAGTPFVDFPERTPGRIQSDLAFLAAGVRRDVAFEAATIDVILGLVRQGIAVALLSPALAADDLVAIEVEAGPTRIEYLAWSDFNPSPAVRALLGSALPQA